MVGEREDGFTVFPHCTVRPELCPEDKVKTEDGWADEIMAHIIRCGHCGQIFTCVVNTWRGSGHFKKGRN